MKACLEKIKKIDWDTEVKGRIAQLPDMQQEFVSQMFQSAMKKSRGLRYTRSFMYACIMLKIKSTSCYLYLRRHKILPLPSLSTIYAYMRKMKAEFGFHDEIFDVVKRKGQTMLPQNKRGVFLCILSAIFLHSCK